MFENSFPGDCIESLSRNNVRKVGWGQSWRDLHVKPKTLQFNPIALDSNWRRWTMTQ